MKTKILSLLLSLILALALPLAALAEQPPEGQPPEGMPGEPPEGGPGGMPGQPPEGGMPGGPGGGSADFEYAAAVEITEAATQTGVTCESATSDESALMVNTDATVTLIDPAVTKTGSSNGGDSCNFYGLNAAVLAMGGGTVIIEGGSVASSADGANGVFCYGGNGGRNGAAGDGTTVYISDTAITTTGDGSGGIMTTGGGVTHAANLTVETSGRSSAAIRTDRGGGTVEVDGGSYTSNGLGSPAIYSTADITVADATLVSNLSEGVCIEGMNSINLISCDLTANNTRCNGNATFLDTIMIYQSMSGDADSGNSSFTVPGGSLTSRSGHVFHVTNTNAIITLEGVTVTNEDSENVLISVCDDGWHGANNTATLNAADQSLEGCVSGQIKNSRGESVSQEVGQVVVTLDETSTWTLTADSAITRLEGSLENVNLNGYTLYIDGAPVQG